MSAVSPVVFYFTWLVLFFLTSVFLFFFSVLRFRGLPSVDRVDVAVYAHTRVSQTPCLYTQPSLLIVLAFARLVASVGVLSVGPVFHVIQYI